MIIIIHLIKKENYSTPIKEDKYQSKTREYLCHSIPFFYIDDFSNDVFPKPYFKYRCIHTDINTFLYLYYWKRNVYKKSNKLIQTTSFLLSNDLSCLMKQEYIWFRISTIFKIFWRFMLEGTQGSRDLPRV